MTRSPEELEEAKQRRQQTSDDLVNPDAHKKLVVAAVDGGRWWTLIPLGLVERGMALTELIALGVLLVPVGERARREPDRSGHSRGRMAS